MNDNMIVPLPGDVTGLLGGLVDGDGYLAGVHPGLALDKYALSWDASGITKGLSERVQRPAVNQVVRLSQAAPPGLDYATLFARWEATLGGKGNGFTGTTAGPLTLHLARASALENAGICLHRIYGFTFLPGTGLKGLARAFAETVWLDNEADKVAGWAKIEAVFGWAPGSDLIDGKNKSWKPTDAKPPTVSATAGRVIFHDAWPETWPKLVTDILNSHHKDYYEKKGPPGDWEDPIPVYFLSVEPKTKFRFAVAPRRDDDESKKLAAQARAWLIGGLTQLGAGAKTASGYGDFKVEGHDTKANDSEKRKHFKATLELVTPAFLAGAQQQQEDCDLRPSTLRGQLRWWWRTMHAGFVTVEQLRAMEAAIWGDTTTGGAVRVTVRKVKEITPRPYSHPRQPPSSGTRYAAYGMDETSRGQRKQRFVMDPGATWEVRVAARGPKGVTVSADNVLSQATAALWLLTQFGGVGSKSRKGFGSLETVRQTATAWPTGIDDCVKWAKVFRDRFGVGSAQLNLNDANPAALSDSDRQLVEFDAGRTNPWAMIERIGSAYSLVAATFKHDDRKAAFGLPRKIHGPKDDGPLRRKDGSYIQDPATWEPPVFLDFPKRPREKTPDKARHTSPIHLHVGKGANGTLVVRLLALPARFLRSRAESVEMLAQFALGFGIEFANFGPPPGAPAPPSASRPVPPQPAVPAKRKTGTAVQVTILQKRAKGGFDVQEAGHPAGTLTIGSPGADVDTGDGKAVTVWLHNDDSTKPQYKWPDSPKGAKK